MASKKGGSLGGADIAVGVGAPGPRSQAVMALQEVGMSQREWSMRSD